LAFKDAKNKGTDEGSIPPPPPRYPLVLKET